MVRSLAISLGSLAMGFVALRAVWTGQLASQAAENAIVALFVFLVIGAIAGAIADNLVRDAVASLYRKRVEWYRNGVAERTPEEPNNEDSQSTDS